MLRPAVVLFALVLVGGCNKAPQGPVLEPVTSDSVQDEGATFQVDVSWQRVAQREAKIVVKMTTVGIEQTDSLVVDVKSNGFVITDGVPDWTGFIRPREKYTHDVSYKLLDDVDSGRIEITIRHSVDSTMLWDAELLFDASSGTIELAK